MTVTQRFIEDAIKGGWDEDACTEWHGCKAGVMHNIDDLAFLDPLAWQAVGKTRGWVPECKCGKEHPGDYFMTHGQWRANLREFTDHLADDKTIEEALALLD